MNGLSDEENILMNIHPTTKGTTSVIYVNSGYTKTKLPLITWSLGVVLRRRLRMRMKTLSQRTDCVIIKRDLAG